MDDSRTVPALSTADAEAFWADGSPAYSAETLQPAAGDRGSAAGEPATRRIAGAVAPGRAHVAGEVPPALRAFLDGECGGLGYCFDPVGSMVVGPVAAPKEWIIQRYTGWSTFRPELPDAACWVLEYEDFQTPEGIMTKAEMLRVLDRVIEKNPYSEFRGHRIVKPEIGASSAPLSAEPLRFILSSADVAEMKAFQHLDGKRDQLLGRLLFAARNLARRNVYGPSAVNNTFCSECWATGAAGAALAHSSSCLTGQTLAIVMELIANSAQLSAYGSAGGAA